jgi:hypothetical protein
LYGGSSNRNEGGVEFGVEAYYIHPDFNPVILVSLQGEWVAKFDELEGNFK